MVGAGVFAVILGSIGIFSGCQPVEGTTAFGPLIATISPAEGPPDTPIDISGSGFGPMVGAVLFTGKSKSAVSAPIVSWSDTSVRALVPAMPSGVQTAAVEVQSSVFVPSEFKVEFRVTDK